MSGSKPLLTIKHHDDESFSVYLDDHHLAGFNHDEDGWGGMEKALKFIKDISNTLKIPIKEIYSEE